MESAESGAAVGPAALERELRLVGEAVALVAGGRSPRVVVGGLRFGESIVEPARRMAASAAVRIVPLWRIDGSGADIAVERAPDR